MSCKSLLYAVNTNTQQMEESGVINFGQVIRRFGQNVNLFAGNAVIQGIGYYKISADFVLTSAGTGPVVIQLYRNGAVIPGAVVSKTTAASAVSALAIPAAVIREYCCAEDTITAVITGDASTITNAALTVEKL